MSKSGFSHKLLSFLIFSFFITLLQGQDTKEIGTLKSNLRESKDSTKLNNLHALTRKYLFQSYDSCIKYGALAVNLAQELQDIEQEALAYKLMGYASYRVDEYDQSISFYKKSIKNYLTIQNYLDVAVITNFIGNTYAQKSDYSQALDYYIIAQTSCDSLILNPSIIESVKKLYSILFTNKGMLYYNLDSINKAMEYFNKALSYAMDIRDSTRITASYSNIGMIYKARGEYKVALRNYLRALEISRIIKNTDYEIAILNNLANIFKETGEIDTSIFYYQESKKLINVNGDKYGLALVNRNIGDIYTLTGNYNVALKYMFESLDISIEIGSPKEIYTCYKVLSQTYNLKSDYKNAFHYYTKYSDLKDSVSGVDTREKVADIQTKYETEKKEKENISLRKNNEIQQLQLSWKNQLIFFLISGIIGFLILSVIIFILFRKRNIAYKQLVEKNLDLINCENKSPFNPAYNKNRNENNGIQEQLLNLASTFENYMKKEKPFLYSEISYDDVCKKLNTNRTYLSKAINESYNKSFPEIINYYRIKEASLYLSNPKYNHLSIEGIGQMTGFNYKAAFYSNFKKQVGITPSFFRKNAQG